MTISVGDRISTISFGNLIQYEDDTKNVKFGMMLGSFTGTLKVSKAIGNFHDGTPFMKISEDENVWTDQLDVSLDDNEEMDLYVHVEAPVYAMKGPYVAYIEIDGTFTHQYSMFNHMRKCTINMYNGSPERVKVRVDYDSDHMKSDFGDIRFATENGTILKYVILELVESDHATFFVDTQGNYEFYILSGNPDAEPQESPEITLFYDDCTGNISDNWEIVSGEAEYTQEYGKPAIVLEGDTLLRNKRELQYPYQISTETYFTSGSVGILYSQDSTPSTQEKYYAKINNNHDIILVDDEITQYSEDQNISSSAETWHNTLIKFDDSIITQLWIDGEYAFGAFIFTTQYYPSGYLGLVHEGEGVGAISKIIAYRPTAYEYEYDVSWGDWESQSLFEPKTVNLKIPCTWTVIQESIDTAPVTPFITIMIDGKDYTKYVTSYEISKDGKLASGMFYITLQYEKELPLTTGMIVIFQNHGQDFYTGMIQSISYEVNPGNVRYTIKGRDAGANLVSDGFSWSSNPETQPAEPQPPETPEWPEEESSQPRDHGPYLAEPPS